MKDFRNSPFEAQLDIVASFRDREIEASLAELRRRDETTIALRTMLRNGVSIDDLSDASGLTPAEIRKRVSRDLVFGEDMDSLTGRC